MIDIKLFREDKGGKPDIVRESQKRRFAPVEKVDEVITIDSEWRKKTGLSDSLNKFKNKASKLFKKKKGDKEDKPLPEGLDTIEDLAAFCEDDSRLDEMNAVQLRKLSKLVKDFIGENKEVLDELSQKRDALLNTIGNLVHESVGVENNEDFNRIEKTWGELVEAPVHVRRVKEVDEMYWAYEGMDAPKKTKAKTFKLPKRIVPDLSNGEHAKTRSKLLNHVDLMYKLEGIETKHASVTFGSRGYYLMGPLVRLNMAIIHYALDFLEKRTYTAVQPPFFMRKDMMARVAQLEEFDEALYKVTGDGEERYLIATSEQPICALHAGDWIDPKALPKRYMGWSPCFRKEAGSHGRDTSGIFRVHQFEKVEQFCLTSPHNNESWKMMEELIENAEGFYQSLNLPYQVVTIVSGKLNNAAAKKWDLEAWFPGSQCYRELVSCSNCTDYQSRRLGVRYGLQSNKSKGGDAEYCHMLNSTLCATSRVMCCIVENYQCDEGIVVPEVLRSYMGGLELIPYKN